MQPDFWIESEESPISPPDAIEGTEPDVAMPPPRVKHYRRAEADLLLFKQQGLVENTGNEAQTMHIISQLSGVSFSRLNQGTLSEYLHYRDAYLDLIAVDQWRLEGNGPWTIRRCACCLVPDCRIICVCGNPCLCNPKSEHSFTFRAATGGDYVNATGKGGALDNRRLVAILTGMTPEDVNEMLWTDYYVLLEAVVDSFTSPLSRWRERA